MYVYVLYYYCSYLRLVTQIMHDDERFPSAVIIISGQIYNFHLADDKKGGKIP